MLDKRIFTLAIIDSFHDFGDGIQLEDPIGTIQKEIADLEKQIQLQEAAIAKYKRQSTIDEKRQQLQKFQQNLSDKQNRLTQLQSESPSNMRERQHKARQTRQYIINTLRKEFENLFTIGKYDRREKFNYYLEKYINSQLKKERISAIYDKNIKDSELFITKLFYAFVFEDKLYDSEFKLKGVESGLPYTYSAYRDYEEKILTNKTINPIFSSRDRGSIWNPTPILTKEVPYKVFNLGNNVKQTGIFSIPDGNVVFYNWMKTLYRSRYIKYFQDANTSMPRNLLCIQPITNVGLDEPNNQSYYIGTAKLYDPGSRIPVTKSAPSAPIAPIAPSAPSTSATPSKSRFFSKKMEQDIKEQEVKEQEVKEQEVKEQEVKDCNFVIPNLTYTLTKDKGELLLFDKMEFIDSTSTSEFGKIKVFIGSKFVDLETERISKESKGVEFFKQIIYEIRKYHYEREGLDAPQQRTLFTDLLKILNNETNKIIKKYYKITLEQTRNDTVFQLSEDDYIRAIFDFKRSGDFGQVAAVKAAMDQFSDDVCPIFVSLDRIAILYAIYLNIPCIYRGDTKSGDILIKCFNFKQRYPKDEAEIAKTIRCTPRIIDGKIKDIFGDGFLKDPKNIIELNDYKENERCKTILKDRLNNKISVNETYYREELRQILDIRNQEILNFRNQGGYESRPPYIPSNYDIEIKKIPTKKTVRIPTILPSFTEIVDIFIANNIDIKPFNLIVLQFIMDQLI
jgi:hypothetical protein